MDEGNFLSARSHTGHLINETDAFGFQFFQCFFDIIHDKGYVLNTFSLLLNEARDRSFRGSGLKQFYFRITDGKKGRCYLPAVREFTAYLLV